MSQDTLSPTQDLLAATAEGVLTLTLNRPAVRNALSLPMLDALVTRLELAQDDPSIRCIVLTGAGPGFCAGGDMKSAAGEADSTAMTAEERVRLLRHYHHAIAGRLASMTQPTIASLPGSAAGAGLSLALACDLRIMARPGVLKTAFAMVGMSGDFGGTYFLTQLVGPAKAREMYLLSEGIDADRALAMGLVNWVCDAADLAVRTREIAARLAQGPAVAFRAMKENIHLALRGNLRDCLDLEATHHVNSALTRDHREAVAAFNEKRRPVFEGR